MTQPGLVERPRRSYALIISAAIGLVIASIVVLLVSVYLVAGLGAGAFVFGGILALVPLFVVFGVIRWIDLWEPEPRAALLFAFLWGAGVAVAIALLAGAEVDNLIDTLGGPGPGYDFFGAAIQAPIVEESAKGFGILILFWVSRKHFDGPVDGLVYAATVAGGFAFTENILYFGQAIVASQAGMADIVEIFLIRGLMSPFAHVMFTACTGILLGIAARRSGGIGAIGYFVLGLIPAMLLHALWNGSLFFVQDFFGYYAVVQFPLFVIGIILVIYLRRQESRLTYDRLAEYAAVGWFNPDEIGALATGRGRRGAMAWARSHGVRSVMKNYLRDSTRLAFARQRLITGRNAGGAHADEALLLEGILQSRRELSGPPAG